MDFPPPPDVAGLSLSGDGEIRISAAEDAAVCRSTGVEPDPDGYAHPIWYFIATQIGMGRSVAGLCAACDFDVADGPMMGGSKVDYRDRIRVDTPYRVTGRITGLTRKRSRKLGVMDVLDYELGLVAPQDGRAVLLASNSWVLPRRALA